MLMFILHNNLTRIRIWFYCPCS